MNTNRVNFKAALQQDNVYVKSEVKSLAEITGMPVRQRYANVVISEGQIVNCVSASYGHLPNELFFPAVAEQLINADISYDLRSINRNNRSFVVDFILNDPSYHINIKNGLDKIKPMLRFTNSYDCSNKTSGHFGFFREVCSNGLHVSHTNIGFNLYHNRNVDTAVMPRIGDLVEKFMDNEFYSLHKKFEVMAERSITDVKEFVKLTCNELKIFGFSASEKNPETPSANAQLVIDAISKESNLLGTDPNLWLGYNAFNEVLHGKLKQTFEKQKTMDARLFDTVLAMA